MMESVEKLFANLLTLGPEMLLFVALIGLGYTLKLVPMVNNGVIPLINAAVAVVVYPMLRQPASAPFWVRSPVVYFMVVGFVIFVASWILHNKVLKIVEDRLGWFDKPTGTKPESNKGNP